MSELHPGDRVRYHTKFSTFTAEFVEYLPNRRIALVKVTRPGRSWHRAEELVHVSSACLSSIT